MPFGKIPLPKHYNNESLKVVSGSFISTAVYIKDMAVKNLVQKQRLHRWGDELI